MKSNIPDEILESGETVVWQGCPSGQFLASGGYDIWRICSFLCAAIVALMICFGLLVVTPVVLSETPSQTSQGGYHVLALALFMLCLVFAAAASLFMFPAYGVVREWQRRRSTRIVVTDRRLIRMNSETNTLVSWIAFLSRTTAYTSDRVLVATQTRVLRTPTALFFMTAFLGLLRSNSVIWEFLAKPRQGPTNHLELNGLSDAKEVADLINGRDQRAA